MRQNKPNSVWREVYYIYKNKSMNDGSLAYLRLEIYYDSVTNKIFKS